MQIKTADLTDTALDWAVAKALGHNLKIRTWRDLVDALDQVEDADLIAFHEKNNTVRVSAEQIPGGGWYPNPRYSTDWSQGGPIIERNGLMVQQHERDGSVWRSMLSFPKKATHRDYAGYFHSDGSSPLIAAMRCFVASKLGDEVDVPDELVPKPQADHQASVEDEARRPSPRERGG